MNVGLIIWPLFVFQIFGKHNILNIFWHKSCWLTSSVFFNLQIIAIGFCRLVSLYYITSFDSIIRRCMVQKEKSQKSDWSRVTFWIWVLFFCWKLTAAKWDSLWPGLDVPHRNIFCPWKMCDLWWRKQKKWDYAKVLMKKTAFSPLILN